MSHVQNSPIPPPCRVCGNRLVQRHYYLSIWECQFAVECYWQAVRDRHEEGERLFDQHRRESLKVWFAPSQGAGR